MACHMLNKCSSTTNGCNKIYNATVLKRLPQRLPQRHEAGVAEASATCTTSSLTRGGSNNRATWPPWWGRRVGAVVTFVVKWLFFA